MGKGKHTVALYGNVAIERGYCIECKTQAFIRDNRYTCCDEPVRARTPHSFERKSEPAPSRRLPSPKQRQKILEEQGNRCLYCGCRFGSMRIRRGKPITLKLNWDHRLPFKYSQNNAASNFAASCHVCNGIKSDKLYDTLEDAKEKLAKIRAGKGYDF